MTNKQVHSISYKISCAPNKTQISMGICPVRSESELCTVWIANDPKFLRAYSAQADLSLR